MLDTNALADFLETNGVTSLIALNRIPRLPARCISIREIPGGRTELQDALDMPHIQIRTRADDDDWEQAKQDAWQIDTIMRNDALWPVNLGGYHCLSMGRVGGGPAYLTTDHEMRTNYVCNYWLRIQT